MRNNGRQEINKPRRNKAEAAAIQSKDATGLGRNGRDGRGASV